MRARRPTIRYRCPATDDGPQPGIILMGDGPRVRRAYRVLSASRAKSAIVGLDFITWKLQVEPMSAERGREEIAAGIPWWCIHWDKRERKRP
jgi:hypothetical protein